MELNFLEIWSFTVIIVRVLLVAGLVVFLYQYAKHRSDELSLRRIHRIVTAFVLSLLALIVHNLVLRIAYETGNTFSLEATLVSSVAVTAVNVVTLAYAYAQYQYLIKSFNK